jgi:hypothetical protein
MTLLREQARHELVPPGRPESPSGRAGFPPRCAAIQLGWGLGGIRHIEGQARVKRGVLLLFSRNLEANRD